MFRWCKDFEVTFGWLDLGKNTDVPCSHLGDLLCSVCTAELMLLLRVGFGSSFIRY